MWVQLGGVTFLDNYHRLASDLYDFSITENLGNAVVNTAVSVNVRCCHVIFFKHLFNDDEREWEC